MTMYLLHPRNHFQVKSEKNDSIFLISILFRITITQRNENETNWKNHWKIYFQNYARIVLIHFQSFQIINSLHILLYLLHVNGSNEI